MTDHARARAAYETYRTTMSQTWPEDYPEDFEPFDKLHCDEQRAWVLVVKQARGSLPISPAEEPK